MEDTASDYHQRHRISTCQPHQLQWVTTANPIIRPQLIDVLQSSIGLEQLVYLYAKVHVHVHVDFIPHYYYFHCLIFSSVTRLSVKAALSMLSSLLCLWSTLPWSTLLSRDWSSASLRECDCFSKSSGLAMLPSQRRLQEWVCVWAWTIEQIFFCSIVHGVSEWVSERVSWWMSYSISRWVGQWVFQSMS